MALRALLSVCMLVLAVQGQMGARDFSRQYTDPATNIQFEGLVHSSGLLAGLVLPQDSSSTDVIVQLQAPLYGSGWVGVALGPGMTNHLLVVAWGNGDKVVASLRRATEYVSPGMYNGTASMKPIKSGTYNNATHLSYTFVCQKCLSSDGFTFNRTDDSAALGWAISTTPVDQPNDPTSVLNFHAGYGIFNQNLTGTKSTKFSSYAAMAV